MVSIDLSGKVAVVTGGSGELGRVMVRTLGRAGADVAVCYYRNAFQAERLVEELQTMGVRGMMVQADITEEASVARMRDQVTAALGAADIIVNNALIQIPWKPLLEQDLADYDREYRSCVVHNVVMAKAFVPDMIRKGWGRVIGISTECVMQCFEGQSAYDAGKRGMDGILRVLAKEVGVHGITVNQVAPGWTISENRPLTDAEDDQAYRERVPLRRRGTDQETANAVAFLASDLASYITGVYLPVCGGNVMPTV